MRKGLASVRHLRAWTCPLAFIALFAALSEGASAQMLYKWVDKDGKTHYSDKQPVGFKGEVTRIEADLQPAPMPKVPPKAAKAEADDEEKVPDIAARRRAERERLAARLAMARARLEEARKALVEGEEPRDGEKQFVQQHHARNERRPDRTPPPRLNCMSQKASDGRAIWNCPTPIPGEAYFSRQKALEEAVQKAEEDLAEAERAYRRGVD